MNRAGAGIFSSFFLSFFPWHSLELFPGTFLLLRALLASVSHLPRAGNGCKGGSGRPGKVGIQTPLSLGPCSLAHGHSLSQMPPAALPQLVSYSFLTPLGEIANPGG